MEVSVIEITISESLKIVEIWLNNSEKNDIALRQTLKPIYDKYKQQKYKVAVFESGCGDLLDSTVGLLLK